MTLRRNAPAAHVRRERIAGVCCSLRNPLKTLGSTLAGSPCVARGRAPSNLVGLHGYAHNAKPWAENSQNLKDTQTRSEPVNLGEIRITRRDLAREVDDHLGLFPGGVVLHAAVDHDRAGAVGHGLQHALGEGDLGRIG